MWPVADRPNAAFGFATAFDRGVAMLPASAAADGRCCLVCSEGVDGQDFSGSGSVFETSCFLASFVPAESKLLRPSLAVSLICRASQKGAGRVVREAALRSDPDVVKGVRDRRKEPLELSAILAAYGLDLSAETEREEARVPRVP